MNIVRKRRINASPELKAYLLRTKKLNKQTLHRAFREMRDSKVCRELRTEAIEKGAYMEVVLPEGETFHDHNGMMRQILGNGVLLECDKETGDVAVFFHDKIVARYPNVLLRDLEEIQKWAAELTD